MPAVFKHCVIGHGLTGTAACKYLAQNDEDVVLLGPSEAKGAHGACYDEGRIYRILDPLQSWAVLAERSIAQYSAIATSSGVDFFHESGLLIFGRKNSDFIKKTQEVAAKMKTKLLSLQPDEISARYTWMDVPHATQVGLLQEQNAGHLSPRKLTQAQLTLAQQAGAEYIDAAVETVQRPAGESGNFMIRTSDGGEVQAENVLVAAGCYTSLLPILPEEVVVTLTGSQALLAEISEKDACETLAGMPSMIYEGESDEDCFYLLPPIKYPDGSWLLKIGPSTAFAPPLHTAGEVDTWFRRGRCDSAFEDKAHAFMSAVFPSVEVTKWRPLLCVTDQTPTQRAYIDRLAPRWGICTGGNGWAAKSSDAIGNLAAQMMYSPKHWSDDPELPQKWFRAVTKPGLLPTPQLETALARVDACGNVMASKAVEALNVLTQSLVQDPWLRRRPARLAADLRARLAELWAPSSSLSSSSDDAPGRGGGISGGALPSVLCAEGSACTAWAPGHPFIAMHAEPLDIVVVLPA